MAKLFAEIRSLCCQFKRTSARHPFLNLGRTHPTSTSCGNRVYGSDQERGVQNDVEAVVKRRRQAASGEAASFDAPLEHPCRPALQLWDLQNRPRRVALCIVYRLSSQTMLGVALSARRGHGWLGFLPWDAAKLILGGPKAPGPLGGVRSVGGARKRDGGGAQEARQRRNNLTLDKPRLLTTLGSQIARPPNQNTKFASLVGIRRRANVAGLAFKGAGESTFARRFHDGVR